MKEREGKMKMIFIGRNEHKETKVDKLSCKETYLDVKIGRERNV